MAALTIGAILLYILSIGPVARYVVLSAVGGNLQELGQRRAAFKRLYAPILELRSLSEEINRTFNSYEGLWLSDLKNRVDVAYFTMGGTSASEWMAFQKANSLMGDLSESDHGTAFYNLTNFFRSRGIRFSSSEYAVYLEDSQEILVDVDILELEGAMGVRWADRKRISIDVLPMVVKVSLPSREKNNLKMQSYLESIIIPGVDWNDVPLEKIGAWIEQEAGKGRLTGEKVRVVLKLRPGGETMKMSLRLKEVPLFEILRIITQLSNTSLYFDGNDIIIAGWR